MSMRKDIYDLSNFAPDERLRALVWKNLGNVIVLSVVGTILFFLLDELMRLSGFYSHTLGWTLFLGYFLALVWLITFRTLPKSCPNCGGPLVKYRTATKGSGKGPKHIHVLCPHCMIKAGVFPGGMGKG
jgi:hypothetical protein